MNKRMNINKYIKIIIIGYIIIWLIIVLFILDKRLLVNCIKILNSDDTVTDEINESSLGMFINTPFNKLIITIIIIIFFIIYPLFIFFYFILNFKKFNYDIRNFYVICKNPLLVICSNSISTYIYYLTNNNIIPETKLFWYHFFTNNNVPTPKILGIIDNATIISEYNSFDNCIIKPNIGSLGLGVKKFDINNIPTNGKYIIQERIKDEDINGYFRITTYYNKDTKKYSVLFIYLIIEYNENKIAGNRSGMKHEVQYIDNKIYNKYRVLSEKNYDKKLSDIYSIETLNKAVKDCLQLHKKINNILIGWDVKIYKKNYYFLEGNYAPSNIFIYDYYYYDKFNKISKINY